MKKRNVPTVELAGRIVEPAASQLKALGLWRCGVLVPDCRMKPYAQVRCEKDGDDYIYKLFCLKHAIVFAKRYGHKIPLPEDN